MEQLVAVGRTELRLSAHDLRIGMLLLDNVLLELLLAHEALIADNAGVWLAYAVHKMMHIAILGATELLATDLAAVVLLAAMAQQMLQQVDRIRERRLAVLALEVAQLRMLRLDVILQQTFALEAALALAALEVRLVLVYGQQMGAPIGTLCKAGAAQGAFVWPLAGMDTLVLLQTLTAGERLAAIRAAQAVRACNCGNCNCKSYKLHCG